MADARFIKPGFYQAVSHTIEEVGEVLSALGKMQRHGPLSVNPLLPREQQETNIAWVWRELGDLEGAIGRLATEIRKDPRFGFLPHNPAPMSFGWPSIAEMGTASEDADAPTDQPAREARTDGAGGDDRQRPNSDLETAIRDRDALKAERDALREGLSWFVKHADSLKADVRSAHSGRGNGASEWMVEDDRDFRIDLREALDSAQAMLAAPQPTGGDHGE